MDTNIHVHLFSADHAPPAQVYYLLRGALHGAARDAYPALIGKTVTTDDLRALDRSLDKFEAPWPALFNLAIAASSAASGIGLISPTRLINMFAIVGHLSRAEQQHIMRLDGAERESDFLRGLLERKDRAKKRGSPAPFRDAMCGLISELYATHEKNAKVRGRITHRDIWQKFLKCDGAAQYGRVVALSVNFDEAFLDDELPGLATSPACDFEQQASELESLAEEVNGQGKVTLLPFLGLEPRGHDKASLLEYVKARVGRDKPWKGLKLYPSMGILPTDDRLKAVFDYCQDESIPVLTHTSEGGAGVRGSDRNFADLSHPRKWLDVLMRLSRRTSSGTFRLCLAHFDNLGVPFSVSWSDDIVQLMLAFNGAQRVEVYADIAFDVVSTNASRKIHHENVKRILALGLGKRILYGSDWWNYIYDCDNETAYIEQLDVDGSIWQSAELDAAANAFLAGVL